MEILNRIQGEAFLPIDLYMRLKKSIRYKYDKDCDDMNAFIDDLPPNLKNEMMPYIYEDTWKSIKSFRDESDKFITWVCPLLRTAFVPANSEVYRENNKSGCLYFLRSGECGFVLSARFKQFKFVDFE